MSNKITNFFSVKANTSQGIVETKPWKGYQKFAFRTFFIYFLLLCIPLYQKFYKDIFTLSLSKFTYHDIQSIVAFWPPQFILIESEEGVFGLLNYINFLVALIIALAGATIWSVFDRKRQSYNTLYYWIIVLARYRLAYGMIGWGLKKIFPMQMVEPTIGMLNTKFLDMAEKKLYWSHVGIEPIYTSFLGFAEFIPGLLLLHRKTATLGAILCATVTFNITLANHAWDAGVSVPAFYFTLIGVFIAWRDIPKLWSTLVLDKATLKIDYYPDFSGIGKKIQTGLKVTGFSVFVILATILWGYGWVGERNNYNIPNTAGLPGTEGYYNVTEFHLNGKEIPYTPLDTIRWQDAIFERWSSLAYTTNRPALVDRMIGYSPLRVVGNNTNKKLNQVNTQDSDQLSKKNRARDLGVTRWEVGGMAGDRRYYYYEADTVKQILHLQNKNRNHSDETQRLHYKIPYEGRIILEGLNEFNDSIYVVLDKLDKKYPLKEGRRELIAY
jgi:hypothetical protein